MKLKKLLGLTLAMVMGLSLLAGCGEKVDLNSIDSNGTAKESTSTNDDGAASSDARPSFTYWRSIHAFTSKGMESHNEHPYTPILEAATGIDVQFINPPVGQEKEKLNLVLSSFDLPDAIHYDMSTFYRGGVDGAIADGIISEDFTRLVEENAPNFMAMINSDEAVRKDAYTDSGTMKNFGAIIPAEEMRGRPFQGPFLNKDILEATGLDVPVTIADWEEMLLAMKANGVEVPLTWPTANLEPASNNFDTFSSAYGVPSGSDFYKVNGEVNYGPIQPGFKEYLTTMSSWYDQGLLDPDFVSRNMNNHIKPMFIQGQVGAVVGHMTFFKQWQELAASENKELNIIATPMPVVNEGDQIHFRHHVPNIKEQGTFVTTAAKDPLAVIKFIDYTYSPEGEEMVVWGTEGETFEVIDGKKNYTKFMSENPNDLPFSYARRQLLLHDLTPIWDWDEQTIFYDNENQHQAWDLWMEADFDYMLPDSLILSVDESEAYTKIMSEVNTYFDEMVTKFIMGIEPMDKYEEFVATIEKMGIDEAISYKQAAYDRYLER